jgi:hypothetical protein
MSAKTGFSPTKTISLLPEFTARRRRAVKVLIVVCCLLMIPALFWLNNNPAADYALSANTAPAVPQPDSALPLRQLAGGAGEPDIPPLPIKDLLKAHRPGAEPNIYSEQADTNAPDHSSPGASFHPVAGSESGGNPFGFETFAGPLSGFPSYAGSPSAPGVNSPGGSPSPLPEESPAWTPLDDPEPDPKGAPSPEDANEPVPEPATWLLLGTGSLGLLFRKLRNT